jgi:hypothetical protein
MIFELGNRGAIAAAVAILVWNESPTFWSEGLSKYAGYAFVGSLLMYWGYPLPIG